jgi:hypothetical protein
LARAFAGNVMPFIAEEQHLDPMHGMRVGAGAVQRDKTEK